MTTWYPLSDDEVLDAYWSNAPVDVLCERLRVEKEVIEAIVAGAHPLTWDLPRRDHPDDVEHRLNHWLARKFAG